MWAIVAGAMAMAVAAGCGGDDENLPVDAAVSDAVAPDAAVDAAAEAAIDAAASCAGTVVGGHCWYRGAPGESCTTVCTAHGGASAATVDFAGAATAGDRSNQANCEAVVTALSGRPFNQGVDNISESNDYGCVEEPDKNRSELVSVNPTVTTSGHAQAARFCACME